MTTKICEGVKVKKLNGFDEYEVKNAADTLIKAEEVKKDSKLFGAVKKEMIRRIKDSNQILKIKE